MESLIDGFMQKLTAFLEKNLEYLALAGCLLALVALYVAYPPAQAIAVVMFCSLAFFYLASGVLVLLDRNRVERVMRLTWFLGMWGLSLMVIGAVARVLFWESAQIMLMAGGATAAAVAGFTLLNRMGLQGGLQEAYDVENKPLLSRLLVGLLVGAALFFSPNRSLYQTFGAYRNDPEYVNLLLNFLDDPGDPKAEQAWKEAEEQKRTERQSARKKGGPQE